GYRSPAMLAAPEPRGASMGEALTVRAMRFALLVALPLSHGCGTDRAEHPLFKLLPPARTGVGFANTITTNDSVDVQSDRYINNGNHTFTEAAARYGIADTGFTTHAVFLDYNRDGCLDLFLLNNSPTDFARGAADTHPLGVRSSSPQGYNKLYRNNCDGTFTD